MKIDLIVTEGMVYDGAKGGAERFLNNIRKGLDEKHCESYKDATGNLRNSVAYAILRNGCIINDESIKPLRKKPIGDAKYSVIITIGGIEKKQ